MKGIYLLVIKVNKDLKLKVGSLGKIDFKKGIYIYVGSAQNSLKKRIKRHKLKKKKIFWHIDYLLDNKFSKIIKIFYKKADKSQECEVAKKLIKYGIPIDHFGSSDCKCKSHLIKIKELKIIDKLNFKNIYENSN